MKTETIVQKFKKGDVQAFRFVYELFYKSAFKAAFFICNDFGLAEDATHEAFLKLQSKIDQLKDPSRLEIWLCRMAANAARDIMRKRIKCTLLEDTKDLNLDNQLYSPDNVILHNEEKEVIKQVISHLQPEYKQVIYLKYYDSLTIEEISTVLGIPAGTVKSRLIRARKEIGKLLKKETLLVSKEATFGSIRKR